VILQGAEQVIGDGPHVPLRSTRCNHQRIGEGAASGNVYEHQILRLFLIETVKNQSLQCREIAAAVFFDRQGLFGEQQGFGVQWGLLEKLFDRRTIT
jgi:hypothetical protein